MKKLSLSFIFILSSIIGTFAQSGTKLEAENANYVDCTVVSDSKYSGGKALQLTEGTAKITFTFTASEKGKYTIYVGYDGLYGEKVLIFPLMAAPVPSKSRTNRPKLL